MKSLIYLVHPRLDRSEISAPMFAAAQAIDGLTCVDLYADYPTFAIDVDREQARLLAHDAIVFLHPFYWYSGPGLLKEWQDLVLEHGFAYGREGTALQGKIMMNAVSCGAPEAAYAPDGVNGADLLSLLIPFEKTANLCGMRYLPPFVLFAAGHAEEDGRAGAHLAQWRALLTALRDDRLDVAAARGARTLNALAADLAAKETV